MFLPVLSMHCTVAIDKTLAVTHAIEFYCNQLQHQPRKIEAMNETTKFLKEIELFVLTKNVYSIMFAIAHHILPVLSSYHILPVLS